MATLIPTDISGLTHSREHKYELETLIYLRDNLPREWTVFHSVHWSVRRGDRNRFGEIDFVVVAPSGKVVVIEQKNGALCERGDRLVKIYGSSGYEQEKDVHQQIAATRDAVLNQYRKCNKTGLYVDWLIFCPDYDVKQLNALTLDMERIVDASSKSKLAAKLKQLADGATCTEPERDKIIGFFMQSYNIVPDVSRYINYQKKTYVALTGGMLNLYDNLWLKEKRLRIQGVAGSGKSQLALHAYKKALERGLRPLLVCFNRPLSDRFRVLADYKDGGVGCIDTFYGLCDGFLSRHGERLDYKNLSPEFWAEVQNKVIVSDFAESEKYDLLIVDEGQDFHAEWLEILNLFMRGQHELLWLEDEQQLLFPSGGKPVINESACYQAMTNYRSPRTIVDYFQKTLAVDDHICGNDMAGYGVGVHKCSEPAEQVEIVHDLIKRALKNGFKPEDIVIVSMRGINNSALATQEKIGKFALRRFTNKYDNSGNQIETAGEIRFDSIYRFKGQQAPLVIIVDADLQNIGKQHEKNRLFCGMTRATLRLEIVTCCHKPLAAGG